MRGCWGRVLIETLWNVNANVFPFSGTCKPVLIETLWNVNINFLSAVRAIVIGFNRNIVECKFYCKFLNLPCTVF